MSTDDDVASSDIESVVLDVAATPEEVTAVEEAFARAGYTVEASADLIFRSTGSAVFPWAVLVALVIPVKAFFEGMFSEAGKDTYLVLKRWVEEIVAARMPTARDGTIRISDPEGTDLVIAAGIPEEALEALVTLDWSELRGEYIGWDSDAGEWVTAAKRR